MSNIFNENNVIRKDYEDGLDGSRGDDIEGDCDKKNAVNCCASAYIGGYIASDISLLFCYILFLFRVGMTLAFLVMVHDPIEIPAANIDTFILNGITPDNYYVLSIHLQEC